MADGLRCSAWPMGWFLRVGSDVYTCLLVTSVLAHLSQPVTIGCFISDQIQV